MPWPHTKTLVLFNDKTAQNRNEKEPNIKLGLHQLYHRGTSLLLFRRRRRNEDSYLIYSGRRTQSQL